MQNICLLTATDGKLYYRSYIKLFMLPKTKAPYTYIAGSLCSRHLPLSVMKQVALQDIGRAVFLYVRTENPGKGYTAAYMPDPKVSLTFCKTSTL